MSQLITNLIGKYPGPALVIGGGGSVLEDLPKLKAMGVEPGVVVGANMHGLKQDVFPCHYSVYHDYRHNETSRTMRWEIENAGGPGAMSISRCFDADYRLPSFHANINCGLISCAVALAISQGPVIVTGLDFYRVGAGQNAPTYFHAPKAESNSLYKDRGNFDKQIRAFIEVIGGKNKPIRPMSGLLLEHFPAFDPDERIRPFEFSVTLRNWAASEPILVETTKQSGFAFFLAHIPVGTRFACNQDELFSMLNHKQAKVVQRPYWLEKPAANR